MEIKKIISGAIAGFLVAATLIMPTVQRHEETDTGVYYSTRSDLEKYKNGENGNYGAYYHHGGYGTYYDTIEEFPDYYNPEVSCYNGMVISYLDYGVVIDRYVLKGTSVTIPKKIYGQYVVAIGNDAFRDCKTLKTIKLPETIEYIGERAFKGCTALKSISLPKKIKYLSVSFSNKDLTYPECGEGSFDGCTSLTSVKIPKNLYAYDKAFTNCTSLKSVVIENGTKKISDNAFNGCTSLQSVKIPGSIQYIGFSAFNGCTSLKSVTLPTGLKEIPWNAFIECKNLKITHNGKTLNCYNKGLLIGNNNIIIDCLNSATKITIPKNVKDIEYYAFYGCTKLKTLTISGNCIRSGVFQDCVNLKTLTISGSVVEIPERAFKDLDSLTTVKISKGVKYIRSSAFQDCGSLKSVTLPTGLVAVGKDVFDDCKKIKVKYDGETYTYLDIDYLMHLLPEERTGGIGG